MKTKLTLVSVRFRNSMQPVFMNLPVDKDGKVRVSMETINNILWQMGCRMNGLTFSIG